jgi:hypothetical protein
MRRSRRLSTSLISSRIEPRLHADLEDGPGGEEGVFTGLDKVNRASHIRRSSSRLVCVDDFVTLRRQRSEGLHSTIGEARADRSERRIVALHFIFVLAQSKQNQ